MAPAWLRSHEWWRSLFCAVSAYLQGQNFQDMEVEKLDKVVEVARKSEVDVAH